MIVNCETEFAALRAACQGQVEAASFRCVAKPFEQLRLALLGPDLTREERLVRLRHALRYAATSDELGRIDRSLPLPPGDKNASDEELALFGLFRRASQEVAAHQWLPQWLSEHPLHGVDHAAMQAAPRPWTHRPPASDPWVKKHLGIEAYRGPGQALAVRSALHLDHGRTLAVVLPTGEGKSLVFQALALAHPNETIAVVVPTVTLALDQELSLQRVNTKHDRYHAYVGGDEQRTAAISAALRTGQQGLLFAAPEAYASSLRAPLLQAARLGRLAAVVIDEAHLVEAWGTDFRSAFQWLGALVAELRTISPAGAKPRVICLSATLSQIAFDTLVTLFSPQSEVALVAATRLRPEQDLWVAPVAPSVDVRENRVIEALRFLPRPAVLYVTQRSDADEWRDRLHKSGFRRVGVVHGETNAATREMVLQKWRAGDLDIVVGTSAFGLGIDAGNVRTVIHACLPETLDRYYQEIGRSGRDNRGAVALLIPALTDLPISRRLSHKTLIGDSKGIGRWRALFHAGKRTEGTGHRILVDITARPGYEPDMRSGRSEDWNINVLNLLVRAGVIRYAGLEWDAKNERSLLAVDICDQGHLDPKLWESRVRPFRARMTVGNRRAHTAVLSLLANESCPSALFSGMYHLQYHGIDYDVTLACGGCVACRRSRKDGWFANWPVAPRAPFEIGYLAGRLQCKFDAKGRIFVGYDRDSIQSRRFQRHLRQFISLLWRLGLRKFVIVGESPSVLLDVLEEYPWCVAVVGRTSGISSSGLPPGPYAVWLGGNVNASESLLSESSSETKRILIVPADLSDPRYPGSQLAERLPMVPLESLLEELDQ
ncbi:protein DpdF [Paraburkholderia sp. J7]|uniref:protein DpdF n=1 Tax=Paraburkholderia sp. J7 TaxID=2805438 RepID=UPI002AB6C8BB|nr:protein DpdF [Paraburkholderia sp. J7]